jgi:hypothetical protein
VSFTSSVVPWTPLRRRRQTCAIFSVHSIEAHVTLLIPTELLNNLMILFL